MRTHELIFGLSHKDFHVRSHCLSIIRDRPDATAAATLAAMQSCEEFGMQNAFEHPSSMTRLPIDEHVFCNVLDSIEQAPERFGQSDYGHCFLSWLTRGPVDTLRAHSKRITQLPKKAFQTSFGNSLTPVQEVMNQRLQVHDLGSDDVLNFLDEKIKTCTAAKEFNREGVRFLGFLAERLRGETEIVSNEQIREWLTDEAIADWEGGMEASWKAGFALLLATERKLETVSSEVIDLLSHDWDWFNEEIQKYLKSVASPEFFGNILKKISTYQQWSEKLFLIGAIEDAESFPELEKIAIHAFSELEEDYDLQRYLARYLSRFKSPEPLQVAEEWYEENIDDPENELIAENLLTVYSLHHKDPDRISRWKKEVVRWHEFFEERRRNSPMARLEREWDERNQANGTRTIKNTEPTVGRNDACPCGSGLKFKKCCMKKKAS